MAIYSTSDYDSSAIFEEDDRWEKVSSIVNSAFSAASGIASAISTVKSAQYAAQAQAQQAQQQIEQFQAQANSADYFTQQQAMQNIREAQERQLKAQQELYEYKLMLAELEKQNKSDNLSTGTIVAIGGVTLVGLGLLAYMALK